MSRLLLTTALLCCAASASAGGLAIWPRYPAAMPFCRMERAGHPNAVAPWARHTYDKRHGGYYVGGGAACGGERRYCQEGTFGVDYTPWYSRVALRWNHHEEGRGGYGQYEPDAHVCPVPELAE